MSGGKLYSTQWSNAPPGASGPSMTKAKVCVPEGGTLQVRAGETSCPSQVKRGGIEPSSGKASDRTIKGSRVGVGVGNGVEVGEGTGVGDGAGAEVATGVGGGVGVGEGTEVGAGVGAALGIGAEVGGGATV